MNRLPRLVGYATKWSAVTLSPKLEGYCVRFAAGAFTRSIASDEIFSLWNHDWEHVLAINRNLERRRGVVDGGHFGILNLREDGHGLAVEIEPPDSWEPDSLVFREIRSGKIRGMSIDCKYQEGRIDTLASGLRVRTVIRAKLAEVSPVYSPSIVETSIRLQLADGAAGCAFSAAPASHGEIIRVDPALVSNPRRRDIHAGMTITC
jgi:HK97 family phage prohead protease